jgi:transposase
LVDVLAADEFSNQAFVDRGAGPFLSTSDETVLILEQGVPKGETGAFETMLEMTRNGAAGREAERAVGERGEAAGGRATPAGLPDPELVERPRRRRFSAEYKLRILREAEACTQPGEIGALVRREGIYTAHLSKWRQQRDAGALEALARKCGRRPANPLEAENADLRRRLERSEAELAKARRVIEVQGNVSALLGELLGTEGAMKRGSTER